MGRYRPRLGGVNIRKKQLSLDQLYKEVSNLRVQDILVEVEYDGHQLILPRELAGLFVADSAGRLRPLVNTSGQVTEANSAANNTHLGRIASEIVPVRPSGFREKTESDTGSTIIRKEQRRLFETVLTATAGGEITSAPIGGAAVAGYQLCVCITHLWSDATDGSIAMAFSATSGIDVGPATWNWATTADTVTDYTPGIWYQCTGDNEVLNVSCAAGQAQANQVIHVLGTYHYE